MAKSSSEIIQDVETYIARFGGVFGEWYVGTSTDPKHALYKVHKLKEGDPGLLRTSHTEIQAAEVVEYFVQTRRTKGKVEQPESGRLHVYIYKRQPHTKP
ncbi:MAG: hypothetical protein ABT940_12885 [Alphaproteobacteria bacterium]